MSPATNVKSIVPYIGSLFVDGVDDRATIPHNATLDMTFPFTIHRRITLKSYPANATIYSKGTNATYSNNNYIGKISNGSLQIGIGGGGNFRRNIYANNKLPLLKPLDITAVYTSVTDMKVYVNGVLLTPSTQDGTGTAISSNTNQVSLHASNVPSEWFHGNDVNARFLKGVALTPEEVLNLHLHNVTKYDKDPAICVLNLETTAHSIVGDQWLDKSGNNNHATIDGATFSYDAPTKRIAQIGAPKFLKGEFDGTVSGGVTIADGAMVFNGGTVQTGLNADLSKDFTIGIRLSSVDVSNTSTWRPFIGKLNSLSIAAGDTTQNLSLIRVLWSTNGGTSLTAGTTIGGMNFGDWSGDLLIVEYNATTQEIKIYKNSELKGTITSVVIGNNTNGILFSHADMRFRSKSGFFHNRTLTPQERTAIFNAGPNAKCSVERGLVAEYNGRDYLGTPALPTKILDVASWSGSNVL
jgi:hypothetical protein